MRTLYTERMVRQLLRRDLVRFTGISEMAQDLKVDRSHLSKTLRGHRPPRGRILASLGLETATVYQVANISHKRGDGFVYD